MRESYFDSEFNAFEDFAINGAIKSFIDSGEYKVASKVPAHKVASRLKSWHRSKFLAFIKALLYSPNTLIVGGMTSSPIIKYLFDIPRYVSELELQGNPFI